ncbi:glycerophosphodiester phosphodiesterase family protein [Cryobacterium sp. PAMC25264]|uniref:glycerophosphodiester phosphodiesterase family protein n=1 Tax=Cryobacterium sp. PAMC25264 TaxID=2861288 RepID=UPI001C631959|nr:glycerophosphodiester phosphodiesterase family protein [Cryobacterium sp. PAMC25264]QYF74858.1 glycerophosphodiester phosphodiesterase [Cryobacterium sp. PAMC25264]
MRADRGSFLWPPGPRILAHRGLSTDAPENTLLAFLQALSHGATHLETDVHASRDGVAVISHDPTLALDGTAVNTLTMAELGRIDLGHGQAYCSLADALAAFPQALFNIDIKAADAVLPTARAIRTAAAARRVLLTSFSETRRRRALRAIPGAATSASAPGVAGVFAVLAVRQHWVLPRLLRGVNAIQVPERAGRLRIVTPRLIQRMHSIGVEVHVWTVNDPVRMAVLLRMGVDGLVTDRCDLAAQVVDSHGPFPWPRPRF